MVSTDAKAVISTTSQLGRIVVVSGNHVGAGLHVNAQPLGGLDAPQHRLHLRHRRQPLIELIPQALDVRAQHVDVWRHQLQGLIGDEAVGDIHGVQAAAWASCETSSTYSSHTAGSE